MVGNPTTLGHHEMEAEGKDDPARRTRTAEQAVSGASPDAIEAFIEMQAETRADETTAPAQQSRWRRLLRK